MLIGQTVIGEFVTVDKNTGAGLNADSLPMGILRKNGTTVGAATVTVTSYGLGRYTASVLIDAAHGWVVGDSYSLEVEYTVQGVSGIFNTVAQGVIETDIVADVDALLDVIKGAGWTSETLVDIYTAVGTRLAAAAYTAPDNAGVALIKAKTDQLVFISGDLVATLNGEVVTATLNGEEVTIDAASAALVDAVLTAAHGAGKWGAPGAGAGQYSITVNVVTNEAGNPPLPGVIVTLQDALDTVVRWGETDASGQLILTVDDGTYSLLLSAGARYQPFTPASVVVSGANVTRNETMVLQSVTPPASPSLCRVYAYEYLNGNPVSNRIIQAAMTSLPQKGTSILYEEGPVKTRTDATGYWFMDLVRGKQYILTIAEAKVKATITIPNQASYDVTGSFN